MADQALIFAGDAAGSHSPLVNGAGGSRRSSAGTALCGTRPHDRRQGIVEIDVVADSEHLRRVHLAVLELTCVTAQWF
jgi:hypothetical protein